MADAEDEFMHAENCCTNPNLPHEVNRARCLASAALIFGILNVFQFGQILSRTGTTRASCPDWAPFRRS